MGPGTDREGRGLDGTGPGPGQRVGQRRAWDPGALCLLNDCLMEGVGSHRWSEAGVGGAPGTVPRLRASEG